MWMRISNRSVKFAVSVSFALSALSFVTFAVELTELDKAELQQKVEKALRQGSERGDSDVDRYKAAQKTVNDFYGNKLSDNPTYNSGSDTSPSSGFSAGWD